MGKVFDLQTNGEHGNEKWVCPPISLPFPSHFPPISLPFPSHFPPISLPFPSHFPPISLPFPSHFPPISLPFPSRFPPIFLSPPPPPKQLSHCGSCSCISHPDPHFPPFPPIPPNFPPCSPLFPDSRILIWWVAEFGGGCCGCTVTLYCGSGWVGRAGGRLADTSARLGVFLTLGVRPRG